MLSSQYQEHLNDYQKFQVNNHSIRDQNQSSNTTKEAENDPFHAYQSQERFKENEKNLSEKRLRSRKDEENTPSSVGIDKMLISEQPSI